MTDAQLYAVSLAAAAIFVVAYMRRIAVRRRKAVATLEKSVKTGMVEPVSLHPTLSPNRCIGIGACANACPEGDIIGIVNGRFELVAPTKCIGHGACAAACPVDAIILVFGTEQRGVELPVVKETFETNVDGIYIAGELGGMGLIRNAVTQGRQAIENLSRRKGKSDPAVYDVAIVGAGPAGIAATLQAEKEGLSYVTFDQDDLGGAVLSYPRQKLVMTQPMEIPLYGKYQSLEIQKEELLDLWQGIVRKTGIALNTFERVDTVKKPNGHFEVTTPKNQYAARNILLTIGRRGTPRKLGVPGEQSSKVTYKLVDPAQYKGKRVLVVGGGDSAVEAAVALAGQSGTTVTLSYRRNAFGRIKEKNQERLDRAIAAGDVEALLESNVTTIEADTVSLSHQGNTRALPNDYVLVFIGGEMPTGFLKGLGIDIVTKFGEQ